MAINSPLTWRGLSCCLMFICECLTLIFKFGAQAPNLDCEIYTRENKIRSNNKSCELMISFKTILLPSSTLIWLNLNYFSGQICLINQSQLVIYYRTTIDAAAACILQCAFCTRQLVVQWWPRRSTSLIESLFTFGLKAKCDGCSRAPGFLGPIGSFYGARFPRLGQTRPDHTRSEQLAN